MDFRAFGRGLPGREHEHGWIERIEQLAGLPQFVGYLPPNMPRYRRAHELEPNNSQEHLAFLRAQPNELKPWHDEVRDWSEENLDEAKAQWERWRGELPGNHETAPAAYDRFDGATCKLRNLTPPSERVALLDQALSVQTVPHHRNVLLFLYAYDKASLGDNDELASIATSIDVSDATLQTDSSFRLTCALMGVADNDWDFVLRCLGDTPEDIPVVKIARTIADVMRIHALDRRGDTTRADAYFAAMCKKTSTAHVAKAFSRAPAAWHVHPRFINKPLRERVRQHAQFEVFLSGLMGILAAGVAYNVLTNHPDEAAVLFLLLPLALIAMGFLLRAARRRFRLAREGLIGVGVVISTQGGSRKKTQRYLNILATIGEHEIGVRSLDSVPKRRAEKLIDASYKIIWHPSDPSVAALLEPIKAPAAD